MIRLKNRKSLVLTSIVALCYLSSCYYDVEQELYPPNPCDTSDVSFTNQITTTLQTYCLNCHSTSSANSLGGGIELETYAGVKMKVDNGKLISAITHDGSSSPMPKGTGSKIPSCDINFITTWVSNGAPNN